MPATVEEVRQLIQYGFPNSDSEVEEMDLRIVGTIHWMGFKKMDPRERNQIVTDRVRNKLGYRGINIGFLLPLTSKDER